MSNKKIPKPLNRINVIDVESTCWEPSPPIGEESEIIEIGISVFNTDSMEIESTESILIRPNHSMVSPFCTKLTTITQELLAKDGVDYIEAITRLEEVYKTKQRIWASFGDYDRKMFERMTKLHKTYYPFGPRHINVKTLIALSLGEVRELGMDNVLEKLGIPLEGVHHRGGDDSKNIAKILGEMMKGLRNSFSRK